MTRAASLYRTMRLVRRFEERAIDLVTAGEIVGGIHPYIGQEAVAAGVCAALRRTDVITSTHRGHGHVLAKGADPGRMMAELAGRTTGLNRGRGGSMHAADLSLGILGANGIVGAGGAIAVGAAWAARRSGSDRVAVSFFGDGALNQGVLLEAFNLARLWSLPVVFVCENNGYATTLPVDASTAGAVLGRAAGFALPAVRVDGMDAEAVLDAAADAVRRARSGGGPAFLECVTYRFRGHHTNEAGKAATYRTEEEIAGWRARDPLLVQGARLPADVRAGLDAEVEEAVAAAVAYALAGPVPLAADALDHLYADGLVPRGKVVA
ncbi:MAG: Acetoin dehydrogenase E1 component alpha-subunit [uncultured Corynebacteriales bacterium]|uniref:Acetoin dehydrogenase E1 component alpha-subunit n=1 Tax=uncultured Mycobacteriales bacterium TaxID=581187 RepID=A0A6J4HBS4_9ACTN|nr:MAG: Acetoin dehydrogenase E1 component alpha-subunit [uncultured Corynebacteriales bacterium]